ncbi:glutathione transferase GstA [Hyalangium rubrum]|uniref:Glutathione transferase GstA n=1 Tax=Hyalangium rubrum TaxID=3103134 RepID=A0ABU5H062_9BACT|nr:glutathione transferase GstA [Hyalangium sp. s54d21]MDY7226832.1 glutathione transferase GstA [Hyalangium sp. s54d21]
MKLYYKPGACSLSPHIVLRESGLKFDLERVDLRSHTTEKGTDYYRINPKGYVPALELDGGQVLTEGPAIVQYIADQKPESKLVPAAGTLERYRMQEWMHFIGTEIHKAYGPLFNPNVSAEVKQAVLEKVSKRFDFVAKQLEGKQFLMGDHFSGPDAYLFVMLTWASKMGPELSRWPVLGTYLGRVAARPAVKAALEAEQLPLPTETLKPEQAVTQGRNMKH